MRRSLPRWEFTRHSSRSRVGSSRRLQRGGMVVALVISALVLSSLPLVSQTRGTADLEKLDSYFAEALKDWNVPGMAIAIVKDGEVMFSKGYGVKHVKEGGTVDEHTLFAIASNSKAFNAAALAILVDEGRIDWDDRVVEHLPYFQLYDPYVTYEMRIRDLLSHRSGLGTFSGDLLWWGTSYSAEEVVKRARFLKPAGPFRARYGYSNLMFIAAGEIVPAVTGQSWSDFVRTRIFQALGMDNTVASVKELQGRENVATPHREWKGQVIPMPWQNWDNVTAAGGIISCASDMAKWLRLQLNRGSFDGVRIFSEESSRTMWTPHIIIPVSERSQKRYPSTHFRAYGLGWGLMDYLGRKVVQHGGAYDGMFSRVALVPEEHLGMVILTNSQTSIQTALMYKILGTFFKETERDWSTEFLQRAQENRQRTKARRAKAIGKQIPNTTPSHALEDYAGVYGGEMYGNAEVKLENGALVIRFLPTPDLVGDLSHWHYDTFLVKWRKHFAWFDEGTVQFLMDAKGNIVEMKVDVPNDDLWFTELEFKRKQ